MSKTGIINKVSQHSFQATYDKLKTIIKTNPNLKIILELDHQANAASADMHLEPTKIIMFGNPKLGTPLMQAGQPTTGLDFPQKMLVTERDGVVSISYNEPSYLEVRHQINEQEEVLQKVAGALDKISNGACGP